MAISARATALGARAYACWRRQSAEVTMSTRNSMAGVVGALATFPTRAFAAARILAGLTF